jgi:transcriptional antiterminator NusG
MTEEHSPNEHEPQAENLPPNGAHPTATGLVDEPAPTEPSKKRWYVVKVQSGREESIKDAIERRVKIEGIEDLFGQIIIPVEKVTEVRGGKRVVKERKLYPGYLMAEVEYNDRILYLFRETSGVGDFVGGGVNHPPQPMPEKEVERMLGRQGEQVPGIAHAKPKFDRGDRVKVKDGTFAGMEGEVKELLEAKGAVRVELTIFGRPVPVELEYWQVEPL